MPVPHLRSIKFILSRVGPGVQIKLPGDSGVAPGTSIRKSWSQAGCHLSKSWHRGSLHWVGANELWSPSQHRHPGLIVNHSTSPFLDFRLFSILPQTAYLGSTAPHPCSPQLGALGSYGQRTVESDWKWKALGSVKSSQVCITWVIGCIFTLNNKTHWCQHLFRHSTSPGRRRFGA